MKATRTIMAFAAGLTAAAAAAATINGDWTVTADTTLTEDTTVSGKLIVPSGVTLNLDGHTVTAQSTGGDEIFTDANDVKYLRLEYIEAEGTQYIITDFTPAAGDRAEIQIAFTEDGGNYSGIFSTRDANNNNNFNLFRTGSNGGVADLAYALRADYGTYNGERFLRGLGDKMKTSAGIRRIVMHTGWPGDNKYHVSVRDVNGTVLANNDALPVGSSYVPAGPLVLMTGGKWSADGSTFTPVAEQRAKLRFYWLKFNADGAKCTIYPVRRLSDGMLGAFNTVTKKFLPPATGTFTKYAEMTAGGTISDAYTQGTRDLTVPGAANVTLVGQLYNEQYSAATLFNNNYVRGNGDVNQRIMAKTDNFPLRVDYDFGEGTPQIVDAYKIYSQQVDANYRNRAPKAWKFYGSNDSAAKGNADDTLWIELDSRSSEVDWGCPEARTYSFKNETAYRYYRIKFTEIVRNTTYHSTPSADSILEIIQLEYFHTGRLCLNVPQGETVSNSAVAISGDVLVVKDGAGSLTMSKANSGFGGERRLSMLVKNGFVKKSGTAPCGASGSRIAVESGAQFDLNGDSYGYYDYEIAGAGPAGAETTGALVNNTAVENAWNHKQFMRNIYLKADATIGGAQNIGMDFGGTQNYAYLNGHVLTYKMADGKMIYSSKMGYAGPGEIAIAGGNFRATMENYPVSGEVSVRVLDGGVYDAQDKVPTAPLKDYIYEAGGEYVHLASWYNNASHNLPNTVVTGRYAPNATTRSDSGEPHPKLQLGAAGGLTPTLDLSRFSAGTPFTATHTVFYSGSTVTVDIGSRQVVAREKLVSWSAIPSGVEFALVADGTYLADNELTLSVEADGLYVKSTRIPAYAKWDATNEEWHYYNEDGSLFQHEWTDASVVPVYFDSVAEFNYIAQNSGSLPYANYLLSGLVLQQGTASVDLSGFAFGAVAGAVIDLKGNTLKLPNSLIGGATAFTVTDSTEASGTLLIDVPANETLANSNMEISGSVHVLKTGEGTFEANRRNQSYTGGTEAIAGLLRCVLWGSDHHPYGANNSEIIISTNGNLRASMDMNGKGDYHNYKFVLNGGHLYNSSSPANASGTILIADLRLTADSTMAMTNYGFIGNGFGPTAIDLGGHKLTVDIGGSMFLFNTTIRNGEFYVRSGGFIQTDRGTMNATDVAMRLCCAFRMVSGMNVRDYESLYTDGWNRNTGTMNVSGVFKPTTDYFWGCRMLNGSTIDLSGRTGSWSTQNLKGSDMQGVRDVTFANGTAEEPTVVTINLDGRTDLKTIAATKNQSGEYAGYVVTWGAAASKPGEYVQIVPDAATAGKGYTFQVDDTGVKLLPKPGFTIRIAELGRDITIPLEWAVANSGETLDCESADADARTLLVGTGANGLPLWKSWCLGLEPSNPASVIMCEPAESQPAGGGVAIAVKNLNVPETDGMSVTAYLDRKTGENAWSMVASSPVASGGAVLNGSLPLGAATGRYRVRVGIE